MKNLKQKRIIIVAIPIIITAIGWGIGGVSTFYKVTGATDTKISGVKEELVEKISGNSERMAIIETQYKTLIDNQNKIINFLME